MLRASSRASAERLRRCKALISVFQAVTQIQEVTLVFVPKIVVVLVSLIFLSPWMMQKMMNYTEQLIVNLPQYVR